MVRIPVTCEQFVLKLRLTARFTDFILISIEKRETAGKTYFTDYFISEKNQEAVALIFM